MSENGLNTSGTNPKDDAAIARYARDMQDMVTTRRRNGNLSREEFFIVTMLSWFHLLSPGSVQVLYATRPALRT